MAGKDDPEVEGSVYVWRCEQLVKAGFDPFPASRLAMSGCDWHLAAELLEQGATQDRVLDILI